MKDRDDVVLVRFLGSSGKSYAYFRPPYLTLSVGDMVCIEARGSYGLGTVVKTDNIEKAQASYASAYVVDKIDTDTLDDYKDGVYYAP